MNLLYLVFVGKNRNCEKKNENKNTTEQMTNSNDRQIAKEKENNRCPEQAKTYADAVKTRIDK